MAPSQLFVKHLDGHTRCLQFEESELSYGDLRRIVCKIEGVDASDLRLVTGTKEFYPGATLAAVQDFFPSITVLARLRGGKGGFGSLLRGAATKAGQKKTSNFDACRDMSGRRLRHVNAEKKLKEWKLEAKERELEKIAEAFLKKEQKKKDEDAGVNKDIAVFREATVKNMEEVEQAVLSGLKESRKLGTNGKRKKVEAVETAAKIARIWFTEGEEDDELDDSEDGEDKDVGPSDDPVRKLQKIEDVDFLQKNKTVELIHSSEEGSFPSQQVSEPAMVETHHVSNCPGYAQEVELCSSCEEVKPVANAVEDETQSELLKGIHVEDTSAGIVENRAPNCSERIQKVELCSSAAEATFVHNIVEGETDEEPPKDIIVENASLSTIENIRNVSGCVDTLKSRAKGPAAISSEKLLNFDHCSTPKDLEVLGLERLKTELQVRGLKCGGSLAERASRLFLLKSTPIELLDKKHFAKSKSSSNSSL